MPEARLERARETLSEHYQFGDGAHGAHCHWPYMRFVVDHGVPSFEAFQRGERYQHRPCPVCGETDHAWCGVEAPLVEQSD